METDGQEAVAAAVPAVDRSAHASAAAWCRLDFGDRGGRVSGIASDVLIAERGHEHEFLDRLRAERGDAAGWVVAFSYEFGVALLGLDPARDEAPPAFALRMERMEHTEHMERLSGDAPTGVPAQGAARASRGPAEHAKHTLRWRRSSAQYRADVDACRAAIHDGEAYVLCLTDTAEMSPGRVDPLSIYHSLGDGALRGGVVVAGDRALVSASPERFLSIRGRRIETHPMKGTRPRGQTAETDAALARELANDPKERAENLMIVDLMRNDLSRVCVPGSVETSGFLRVESHPHVHQLVSTVAGTLASDADVYDAIAACFPGGSMTGAPKYRAVELLAALEHAPRGLYSGCFGWISADGDAELAMTIRSIELRGLHGSAPLALIGSGGGVTADSEAEREAAEKNLKAASLVAALEKVVDRPAR